MGYSIALSSAADIIVENNHLTQENQNGNGRYPLADARFLGKPGPTCLDNSTIPHPWPFIADTSLLSEYTIQADFNTSTIINNLICLESLGSGVDLWPLPYSQLPH